jgi:hypothetical protein
LPFDFPLAADQIQPGQAGNSWVFTALMKKEVRFGERAFPSLSSLGIHSQPAFPSLSGNTFNEWLEIHYTTISLFNLQCDFIFISGPN